jgi:hypothetical protein
LNAFNYFIIPSKCLENCYLKQKEYEHGETHNTGCRICKCDDGTMRCEALACPEPPCPEDQQFTVTEDCCKYCKGIINITQDISDYDNTNNDNLLEVKPER